MEKLWNIIVKAYEFGKLPKHTTPYIVARLANIYNALKLGDRPEFIESDILEILTKCGIKTEPSGIGWIAYN